MKHYIYLIFLVATCLPVCTNAQIIKETLFADTEQKEGGQIDFQLKVSDGIILGGRFLENEGYATGLMKLDTSGTVKWTTLFRDTFNYPIKLLSPFMDAAGNLFVLGIDGESFSNYAKSYFQCRINTADGTVIWKKYAGIYDRYDYIGFNNFDDSTCLMSVFKYEQKVELVSVNKRTGNATNIVLPTDIINNVNNPNIIVDKQQNVYINSRTALYKLDGKNGYKLLWSVQYEANTINRIYADKNGKLYVLLINTFDRLRFYAVDPLNGNTLYQSNLGNSRDGFNVAIKETDDALYFINSDRFVGAGIHAFSIFKYSNGSIQWDNTYLIEARYSTARAIDIDANGFLYVTGHNSTNETITGDWVLFKIRPADGSTVYKNYVRPDPAIEHEISAGKGVFIWGNKAVMVGQLQTSNRAPNVLYRSRLAFIPFDAASGQRLGIKYFSGNYQFEAKTEQILTTDDRVIVIKQKGLTIDVESYNLDKRLVWKKTLDANYWLTQPIAGVSPTGNIGLVARGYSISIELSLRMDSLVFYALDKNGQLLWRKATPDSRAHLAYKDVFFNDADKSIILSVEETTYSGLIKLNPSLSQPLVKNYGFTRNLPINRVSGINNSHYLQIHNQGKWCAFNMTTFAAERCTQENNDPPYLESQLPLPLTNNKMFFGLNDCNYQDPNNVTWLGKFILVNSATGNFLWTTNVSSSTKCDVNNFPLIKLATDKSEQNFYALFKSVDSIFMYKINALNGNVIYRRFLFSERQAFNIEDFVISQAGDKVIITGNVTQPQFGGNFKNTFIRVFDATTTLPLSYELKKGQLKGDNIVGRGMAFFPDSTFWVGGNMHKLLEGKAGIIYESNLTSQTKVITGQVVFDKNNNGLIDSTDIPLPNAVLSGSLSKSYAISDSLGFYTITLNNDAKDTLFVNVDIKNATYKPRFYIISPTDTVKNFLLSLPSNTQDLRVNVTEVSPPRGGFNNIYSLFYKNVGNTTTAGKIRLQLNNIISITDTTPPAPSRDSISYFWNFTNLKPNEERSIAVFCKTELGSFGNKIFTIASIDPIAADVFKSDNIDTLIQTVVGSYDPNDKQVSFKNSKTPPSVIDPSTELIYTIRFQNTGNYPADFVKVVDTLSDKLDVSTFRLLATSHKVAVSMRNKNVLTFDFDPIYLPDSIRDEKGSHGFVKFAIKPKRTLTKDEAIKNTGYIYFDYNPAIITNTVETANQKTSSFIPPSVSAEKLNISPNPAQQSIKIDMHNADFKEGHMRIYDLSGRLILSKTIVNKEEIVNIAHLKSGEYICTVQSNDKIYVSKFVKVE